MLNNCKLKITNPNRHFIIKLSNLIICMTILKKYCKVKILTNSRLISRAPTSHRKIAGLYKTRNTPFKEQSVIFVWQQRTNLSDDGIQI